MNTAKTSTPTRDQWRALYAAAETIRAMAPWTWMLESDIFGVEDPATSETHTVSVMGTLGEHLCVAVYLGQEGFFGYQNMQTSGPNLQVEDVMLTPQLQASWENRDSLEKPDREVIKSLNLKFRGDQQWPVFRRFHPSFVPWFIEADGARLLTLVLEQLSEIAPRLKENKGLLPNPRKRSLLVRVAEGEGAARVWRDEVRAFPPPPQRDYAIAIETDLMERVKRLEPSGAVQMDLFLLPSPVGNPDGPPYFPHALLIVDARSGFVISSEMLPPLPDFHAMIATVPQVVVSLLAQAGIRPREIQMSHHSLSRMLEPVARAMNTRVKLRRHLGMLHEAKTGLIQHMLNYRR